MRIINNTNLYINNININKSFLLYHENNDIIKDIKIHNDIFDLYISNIKNKKLLSIKYFKILLPLYYKIIFNKTMVYKNIKYDITLQDDLNELLNDYSFINLYNIFLCYINNKNINLNQLTAMFYATLYYINKEIK